MLYDLHVFYFISVVWDSKNMKNHRIHSQTQILKRKLYVDNKFVWCAYWPWFMTYVYIYDFGYDTYYNKATHSHRHVFNNYEIVYAMHSFIHSFGMFAFQAHLNYDKFSHDDTVIK